MSGRADRRSCTIKAIAAVSASTNATEAIHCEPRPWVKLSAPMKNGPKVSALRAALGPEGLRTKSEIIIVSSTCRKPHD